MPRKFLIWAGGVLLLAAAGFFTSDNFFVHYGQVVTKTQNDATGAAPLTLHDVSPSYFSVVTEPDDGIAPVLSRIQHAQKTIDLVIYQLNDSQVEQALADAVTRGVQVRVLLNGGYYEKKESANDAVYARLQQLHVPVKWTPTNFALTHQKTLIVDSVDALIMTFNLQQKYYATGRDFAIDDTNPNDVAAIEKTFEADWNGNAIAAPQGDDLLWSPGSEEETLYLINSATSSLKIYNEEMADNDVTDALVAAAKRGVTVQLDMTYATNWKAAFTELAQAGVQVRTYASSSKVRYIHAKMIMVDGVTVFVGSENFSQNSLNKNRELGIVLRAPAVVASLSNTFDSDWKQARPFVVSK